MTNAKEGPSNTKYIEPYSWKDDVSTSTDEVIDPVVVAAIDFGTTYTGYAFSFKDKTEKILTSRHGGMLNDDRVPTIVLLNPDKSLKAFGDEAVKTYEDIPKKERSNYFYLEYFKTTLYRAGKITRETVIKDIRNKEINALHVFTEVIKYFYSSVLNITRQSYTHLEENQIDWILTIPAIWTDSARQFMREAATKGGISEDRLRLVLEPEAASLFCRETKSVSSGGKACQQPVGHKYILADLGGGTADVCVHEILGQRELRELYYATGGCFGGQEVNKAYIDFLEGLFTPPVMREFIESYPNLFFDMMKDFERKKKTFSSKESNSTTLHIEVALLNILKSQTGKTLNKRIKKTNEQINVTFKKDIGRLIISKNLMEMFFRLPVKGIVKTLQEVLDATNDRELKTIQLVGGFAESPYVRDKIAERFPDMTLILHNDTRLAVLKGAVMMGFMPCNIVQRRARFTYGFNSVALFIPGEHPESLKWVRDGKDWCWGVFVKMIEKGQLLKYGDTFTMEGYHPAMDMERKHLERHTELWRSNRRNPIYCKDEPGEDDCDMVGVIVHKPPHVGWQDYVETEQQLIVGETELTVKVTNKTTGEEYKTQVNFL